MHAGDDEGRRHDVAAHTEPGTDALHERGLAGTERPAEHDQVTGTQHRREAPAELAGVGCGRQLDQRSACRTSRSNGALARSGRSMCAWCPASGTTTSSACGSGVGHRLAVLDRRDQIVLAADDHDGNVGEPFERRFLLVRHERGIELGDHVDGGGADHPGDELDQRRIDIGAEREALHERPGHIGDPRAAALDEGDPRARAAQCEPDDRIAQLRQAPPGCRATARRPCRSTCRAKRRRRLARANSSGCASASDRIVMPPIECPISTTRPAGASSSSTV